MSETYDKLYEKMYKEAEEVGKKYAAMPKPKDPKGVSALVKFLLKKKMKLSGG